MNYPKVQDIAILYSYDSTDDPWPNKVGRSKGLYIYRPICSNVSSRQLLSSNCCDEQVMN